MKWKRVAGRGDMQRAISWPALPPIAMARGGTGFDWLPWDIQMRWANRARNLQLQDEHMAREVELQRLQEILRRSRIPEPHDTPIRSTPPGRLPRLTLRPGSVVKAGRYSRAIR